VTATAELTDLAGERVQAIRRRLAAWREGFISGFEAGRQIGYCQAEADMAQAWQEAARPLSRPGPSHAELERLRWGPGGRARFGDPRPGDYRGRAR
jgi:hypothetical protein